MTIPTRRQIERVLRERVGCSRTEAKRIISKGYHGLDGELDAATADAVRQLAAELRAASQPEITR
jgi:16S rRNA U516 pseudouridylate synthase RsuA-like enzyme